MPASEHTRWHTMHCRNCDNTTDFELTLHHTIPLTGDPQRLSASLQCRDCHSLDVTGDPASALADLL